MIPLSETARIAQGLIEKNLPKAEWTHQAHLRAGLWHTLRYDAQQALTLMRERIRAYNEATGVTNTATSGYHETITRFYLLMIRDFMQGQDAQLALDELADLVILHLGSRDLPFQFYSRELLFSVAARSSWVAPDLAPLPFSVDQPIR